MSALQDASTPPKYLPSRMRPRESGREKSGSAVRLSNSGGNSREPAPSEMESENAQTSSSATSSR